MRSTWPLYIVVTEAQAHALFAEDHPNVLAGAIEMLAGGAVVVELSVRRGKRRFDIRATENGRDVQRRVARGTLR